MSAGSRARRLLRGGATALVVPVPSAAAPVTVAWGGTPPVWARGMPPHVTVLFPFLAAGEIKTAVLDLVGQAVATVPTFEFSLGRLARFPGVLYLAPDPVEPFARITAALAERFPGHPPYAGAFESVVPHLTVAEGDEPAGLADALRGALPLVGFAEEVWLMAEGRHGRWRRRAVFGLRRS